MTPTGASYTGVFNNWRQGHQMFQQEDGWAAEFKNLVWESYQSPLLLGHLITLPPCLGFTLITRGGCQTYMPRQSNKQGRHGPRSAANKNVYALLLGSNANAGSEQAEYQVTLRTGIE